MSKFSGVYQIRNLVNGKVYIGSAINIGNRWKRHIKDLRGNKHHSIHLQRSWNKDGEDVFVFEIIESVDSHSALIKKEQYWLDKTKCYEEDKGYNVSPTAGSPLGVKHTEKTKKKLSESRKGRKLQLSRERLEEKRKTMLGDKNPMFGKHHSEEAKKKISEKLKNREFSIEHREKISLAKMGNRSTPGESNIHAKLNNELVKEIRELYKKGSFLVSEISKMYSVSWSTIDSVVKNKTWKEI